MLDVSLLFQRTVALSMAATVGISSSSSSQTLDGRCTPRSRPPAFAWLPLLICSAWKEDGLQVNHASPLGVEVVVERRRAAVPSVFLHHSSLPPRDLHLTSASPLLILALFIRRLGARRAHRPGETCRFSGCWSGEVRPRGAASLLPSSSKRSTCPPQLSEEKSSLRYHALLYSATPLPVPVLHALDHPLPHSVQPSNLSLSLLFLQAWLAISTSYWPSVARGTTRT